MKYAVIRLFEEQEGDRYLRHHQLVYVFDEQGNRLISDEFDGTGVRLEATMASPSKLRANDAHLREAGYTVMLIDELN